MLPSTVVRANLFRRARSVACCVLLMIGTGEAHADTPSWFGRWQGFAPFEGDLIRFELTLAEVGGTTAASLDLPDLAVFAVPVLIRQSGPGTFEATSAVGPIQARFNAAAARLAIDIQPAAAEPASFELQRRHPDFAVFDSPRLDAHSRPVTSYTYRAPAAGDWPVASASAERIDSSRLAELVSAILEGRSGRIDALLVARNGQLVLDEYFFGHDAASVHTIQSVTKSVTSLLVGVLLKQHPAISVDDPVYPWFPNYEVTRWVSQQYPITIEHLLTMSAAIDWNETVAYTDPENSNTNMNASADWIGYVLDREQAGEPGTTSSYTSGLSILLGGIVARVSGQSVDEFARDHLFDALNIERFNWTSGPGGAHHTGGGLSMRARDLAKLGQLVLGEGAMNGQQLVSADYLAASAKRLPLAGADNNLHFGYGYQWWLRIHDDGRRLVQGIEGIGYGGQYLGVFPALDLVIVMNASEYLPSEDYDMDAIVVEILQATRP